MSLPSLSGMLSGQGQPNQQFPQGNYGPQGQQGAYAQQGGYGPQQGGYPPQQGGYGPQGGYPPQQGGFGPQQGGYPPQQGGFGPQQGGYPPQQGGWGQPMQPQGKPAKEPSKPKLPTMPKCPDPTQNPKFDNPKNVETVGGQGFGPQQGGFGPQQGGYPPQQGGYQQNIAPESAHEHPLNYCERLNEECKMCGKNARNQPGYNCRQCNVRLCMNCAQRVFYGNKKKQVHPHPLALRNRQSWKCDICKKLFNGTCSFYCKPCDFDACERCYLEEGGFGPQQGGYPPQQGGYPPQQGGFPPRQGGFPPQQGGFPPHQGGYPPQQGGYPYPPSQSYGPHGGWKE